MIILTAAAYTLVIAITRKDTRLPQPYSNEASYIGRRSLFDQIVLVIIGDIIDIVFITAAIIIFCVCTLNAND